MWERRNRDSILQHLMHTTNSATLCYSFHKKLEGRREGGKKKGGKEGTSGEGQWFTENGSSAPTCSNGITEMIVIP